MQTLFKTTPPGERPNRLKSDFLSLYHVSKQGDDSDKGTSNNPFKTISKAASIARPGDVVIVHEGVYREWVNPLYGGTNEYSRIIYQAAEGENVIIKGSEVISDWMEVESGLWKAEIDNSIFGDYNPYLEVINGDFFIMGEMPVHTGEVYLNNRSLYEVDSLEKVKNNDLINKNEEFSKYKWYCEVGRNTTAIWANFHEYNPNKELAEINVRPACFFPKKTGINYITVKGFHISQAATQWAAPTSEQIGAIGPNYSKGWIIEENIISHSRCTGISLGLPAYNGQSISSRPKEKHGTQYQREIVFEALAKGWSKETVGSHIVRGNTIYNCEQTGICGHLGAIFSEISHNYIYDIHAKKQFNGYERAGIKIHAGIDVLIKNNVIHNAFRGIWIDWQGQGMRITGNTLFHNENDDMLIEVCHGPHIVDNNLFLSGRSFINASQGGIYVHNLFAGEMKMWRVIDRFTPYHLPHSTMIKGYTHILNGDDHFYNNIFIKPGKLNMQSGITEEEMETSTSVSSNFGLNIYNGFPLHGSDWINGTSLREFYDYKYPVSIANNLYLNGAKPYENETGAITDAEFEAEVKIEKVADKYSFILKVGKSIETMKTEMVSTKNLGVNIQVECPYEDFYDNPILFNIDMTGQHRNSIPTAGPFENLKENHSIHLLLPGKGVGR